MLDPATGQGLALHVALRTRSDSTCSDVAVLLANACTQQVADHDHQTCFTTPGKSPTRKSILGRTTKTSPGPLRGTSSTVTPRS